MPPSFSRHFSEKVVASTISLSSVPSFNLQNQDAEFVKAREIPDLSTKSDNGTNLDTKHEQEKESSDKNSKSVSIHPTHIQSSDPQFSINNNVFASPPWKHASAGSLTVKTPAQSTPKRVTPNTDDNHKGIASQKQESSCKAAKRSLDFSLVEGDQSECCKFLPDNFSQTLCGSSALLQKVEEEGLGCAAEEHKMSQTDSLNQQTSIYLPGLVSLIHHVFQAVNYAPITKEELVHKIIISSFDFHERRQVEEQIEILEKLAPDWICMKLASTGDVLYSIKKISDLDSFQSKVAIANPT